VDPDKIGILLEVLFYVGSKWQWIGWMFGLRSEPEGLHACLVPNSFWAVDLFTQNVDND